MGEGDDTSGCSARAKLTAFALLACCYILQSTLVYSDPSPNEPLPPRAVEGRQIWQRENCQSCHQLYGFGGFLGPDLTNAWPRLTPERLQQVLTQGTGAMPAFRMTPGEIQAISAFLEAMDASGRGQARGPDAPDQAAVEESWVELQEAMRGPEGKGLRLFRERGCASCHPARGTSPVAAPELWTVTDRLDERELRDVLAWGRPPRMPRPQLDAEEQRAVYAFLVRWGERRRALRERERRPERGVRWSEVPWWEY